MFSVFFLSLSIHFITFSLPVPPLLFSWHNLSSKFLMKYFPSISSLISSLFSPIHSNFHRSAFHITSINELLFFFCFILALALALVFVATKFLEKEVDKKVPMQNFRRSKIFVSSVFVFFLDEVRAGGWAAVASGWFLIAFLFVLNIFGSKETGRRAETKRKESRKGAIERKG